MRRALLYATFNGVANCTNGIGRQTQTLLSTIAHRWDELTAVTGAVTPYIAIPTPGSHTWGYEPDRLRTATRVLEGQGGRVLHLPHDTTIPFWSPPVWEQLSTAAAQAAVTIAADHDQVLVIAVDTPFLGTGRAYHALDADPAGKIQVLLTPYGTSYIHNRPPDDQRLAWERAGLAAACGRVHVADIGHYLTRHLIQRFAVDPTRFIRWRSSLDLTAPDLAAMHVDQAATTIAGFGIPVDRPIVLFVGRTDPTKGFDLLIDALRPIGDAVHLVAIIVPTDGHDPLLQAYRDGISSAGLRATLITRFERDLPRALAGHPATRVAVCPSRGETLANLPFEISLWARHAGPVLLVPDRDGFSEQVDDAVNGLLYHAEEDSGLTEGIRRAMSLTTDAAGALRAAAYQRVIEHRDVVPNLADTLRRCFHSSPADG